MIKEYMDFVDKIFRFRSASNKYTVESSYRDNKFSEPHDSRISQRGKNGATTYFLVPRELRHGINVNAEYEVVLLGSDFLFMRKGVLDNEN